MKKASMALVVLALIICVGLGAYIVTRRSPAPLVPQPVSPTPQEPAPVGPPKTVKIYQVVVINNETSLKPIEVQVPAEEDSMEAALKQLIQHKGDAQIGNPIPAGTKLLSLKVKNGLAKVDLSREFQYNFAGGSEAESFIVRSILTTLGQFPEIKKAQIMVEGKPLETLGHLELTEPMDVIRQ